MQAILRLLVTMTMRKKKKKAKKTTRLELEPLSFCEFSCHGSNDIIDLSR
jgi:hypothetical protein